MHRLLDTLYIISALVLGSAVGTQAQDNDPILFTVGDAEVGTSEFNYIYSKTNGDKADFSRQSLEEYLDLYIKFKLKVQEAKRLQIDTIPSLQRELETYRRQLSDSYLMDKQVTEKLAREAFDRMQTDVRARHILISLEENDKASAIEAAYDKAVSIKKELEDGGSFRKLAAQYSNHRSSRLKGGDLGFMTAMLPEGFYPLESALYEGQKGQTYGPIRTKLGYHILEILEKRPARGKRDLAHILIRNKEDRSDDIEESLIRNAFSRLESGENFAVVAASMSEDQQSASKKGFIGTYAIGLLEPKFEDVAFAIDTDGGYSEPFRSSVGWHIVQRIAKKDDGSYQDLKQRIIKDLSQTERQDLAKQSMIERIQKETNFKINEDALTAFVDKQNNSFYTYKWKPSGENGDEVLFTYDGGYPKTVNDFEAFISRAARARLQMIDVKPLKEGVREVFDLFVEEICLKYEESVLLKKYPDFRNLMREYEEGILLFEVTDMEVWKKASRDSIGLKKFFSTIDGKYRWGDMAQIEEFTLHTEDPKWIKKFSKWATKKGKDVAIMKLDKKGITSEVSERSIEKGKAALPDGATWTVGSSSNPMTQDGQTKVSILRSIESGKSKTLNEARGYIIADYQEQLEKNWIDALRERFEVKINQSVLTQLVKS